MRGGYAIVDEFEDAVAEYTGAPHAVAVDSCTNALFLCCRYLAVEAVTIPARTFFSVPAAVIHAGGSVNWKDASWRGQYRLEPYPIVDSACRLRRGMYEPGTFCCLSFDARKHLPIGRGGMILCDSLEAVEWFRRARFSGRDEKPRMESTAWFAGWKAHMLPEEAARGITLMLNLPDDPQDLEIEYPDLSQMEAYR